MGTDPSHKISNILSMDNTALHNYLHDKGKILGALI